MMLLRIRRNWRSLAAMVAVPIAVVGVLARNFSDVAALQSRATPEYVESPAAWVPFSATVTVTFPGRPAVVGRYFRASTGSYRTETGPALDSPKVIFIKNIPEAVHYLRSDTGWIRESQPSIAAQALPPRFRKGPLWTNYPYKLDIRKGETGSVTAASGWSAYQVTDSHGVMKLKVADLNLFDVVTQRPDGRYETYTDIELGEPDSRLFAPPVGVPIEDRAPRQVILPTTPR